MLTSYTFAARDNAALSPGTRKTGLTPTWVFLKRLPDKADIAPQPAFVEIMQGQYLYEYDAETYGDAAGQIDLGPALANPCDRYVDVLLTRESARILAALTALGANLNLAQAVPAANAAQTVGDALNAARAQGFGRSVIDSAATPPTQTLYAGDGVTVVHTFTLDNAQDPAQRL